MNIYRIARRIAFVPDIVTMTDAPTLDNAVNILHSDIRAFKNTVTDAREKYLSKTIESAEWIPTVKERIDEYTSYIIGKIENFFRTVDRNSKSLGILPFRIDFNFVFLDFYGKIEKTTVPFGSNFFLGTPSFPKCSIDDQAAKDFEQAIYILIHDPIHEILDPGSSKYLAQHDQHGRSFTLKDRAMEDIPARLTESRYYDVGVINILMNSIRDTLFSDRSRFRRGDRAKPIESEAISDELIKISGKIKGTPDFRNLDPFYKDLFNQVVIKLEAELPDAIRSHPRPEDLIHFREFSNLLAPIMKSAYETVIDKQWTKKDKVISDPNAKVLRMYMTFITKVVKEAGRILNKPLPIKS